MGFSPPYTNGELDEKTTSNCYNGIPSAVTRGKIKKDYDYSSESY